MFHKSLLRKRKIVLIFWCVECNAELKVGIDALQNKQLSLYKPCPECKQRKGYLFLRRAYEND